MKSIALYYSGKVTDRNGKTVRVIRKHKAESFVKAFIQILRQFASGANYIPADSWKVTNGVAITEDFFQQWTMTASAYYYTFGTQVGLGTDSIYITPDGENVQYMTNVNFPAPLVASQSTVQAGYGYCAFDGTTSVWGASTWNGWLKLDTGAGISNICTSYSVKGVDNNYSPKDWTLEGSNDDSTWDVIHTVTNQTGWGYYEIRTFTPDVMTTAYRYFRLNVSSNVNHSYYLYVAELVLYRTSSGTVPSVTINDYRLNNLISHGTGTNQLQYSAETFGAPSTDASKTTMVFTRVFTNQSASSIAIKEIGMVISRWSAFITSTNNTYKLLIARDVLDPPITLAVGESVTVNYTLSTAI